MPIRVGVFGYETEESFLIFVIGAIRYPMQRILMQNFLSLGLLNGDPVDGNGQLCLGHFPIGRTRLGLLQLLVELEFLHALLHNFDAFWLVDFDITKKL